MLTCDVPDWIRDPDNGRCPETSPGQRGEVQKNVRVRATALGWRISGRKAACPTHAMDGRVAELKVQFPSLAALPDPPTGRV